MKKLTTDLIAAICLMTLVLGLPGCVSSRVAQVTPSQAPTSTTIPSVTPTPTATATLTPTPLPTATVTMTATPKPSPTPDGFFSSSEAGFSITYPADWLKISGESANLFVTSPKGEVIMMITTTPNSEPVEIGSVIQEMRSGMPEGTKLVMKGTSEPIELTGGVKARKAVLTLTKSSGKSDMWLIYTNQNPQDYMIVLIGQTGWLDHHEDEISPVLASFTLLKPKPYDVAREETITQLGGDPQAEDLDPAMARGSASGYVGLLYSGLVRLGADLQVAPDLAESWKISGDGKVYTFTLREGVKFANGTAITAEDVRKSWDRALNPKTKSNTAMTYLGDIQGAADRASGKAWEISGLKVIDPRTLEVTLDGAKPYFLAKLTYPTSYVIDTHETYSNADLWMFNPNSSGAYQVKEYRKNEVIIFSRNPNYFKPVGVNNLVYIFHSGGALLSLYQEGTLDILPLDSEQIQEISKADNPLNKELLSGPSMCTDYLALNTTLAPTDDPLVRKALFLALDRNRWVDKLSNNLALLAAGILPPAMPGYQQDRALPAFDPQAAKEALSQSKYAGQNLTITLSTSGYADSQPEDAALLVDQWQKNLGIKVKVELIDPEKFTETVRTKPGNVVSSGWCADYPDPENFLDILFHSNSNFNYANLNDPELDRLLEQARTELDPAKRLSLYQQAETRILEQFYTIPMSNGMEGVLVKPRVKNYQLVPIGTKLMQDLEIGE